MEATFSGVGTYAAPGTGGGPARGAPLLRALRWAASSLARPLTTGEIAEVAVGGALMAVDASVAVVALAAKDDRRLRRIHAVGLSDEQRSIVGDPAGLIAQVANARRPTFLRSLARPPERRSLTVFGGGALVALPIQYGERALGVIVLGWPVERDFSADERAFLTALADQCSLALAHAVDGRESAPGGTWHVGDLEIDPAGNRVVVDGRPVHLTPSEFHMLVLLAEEPGRCRTRRELLSHMWHTEHVGDERACDAHLANLRKKIERDPSRPERLVTVRGLGYALRIPPRNRRPGTATVAAPVRPSAS
jgi:DNA-binding winged helix-turn-helix (wHTH) protein